MLGVFAEDFEQGALAVGEGHVVVVGSAATGDKIDGGAEGVSGGVVEVYAGEG